MLASLLLLAPAPQAWIVDDDGGPNADFTSISAAVHAAADGDVILVRPGTYSESIAIEAKGLELIGQPGDGQPVVVDGSIHIRQTSSLQTVALSHLTIVDECWAAECYWDDASLIGVEFADGPVVIDDCTLEGTGYLTGIDIEASPQVFVTGAVIRAGDGGGGIELLNAGLHLFDADITGGYAPFILFPPPMDGGLLGLPAILANASTVVVQDSRLEAGTSVCEGLSFIVPCSLGLQAAVLTGSSTGYFWSSMLLDDGGDPDQGPNVSSASTSAEGQVTPVALDVPRTVAPDDDALLGVVGASGAAAFLLFENTLDPRVIDIWPALSAFGPAPIVAPLGTIPTSGTLETSIGIPFLPPGVATFRFQLQAAIVDPLPAPGASGIGLSSLELTTIVDLGT